MEYAPPSPILVLGQGNDIVYYDKQLDQVSHVPMDSTLVGFLTRDPVRFDKSVVVTGCEEAAGVVQVSLVQANAPKDGVLTLEFSDRPCCYVL